eukprot:2973938-Rhodomonas_salina.1
MHSLTQNPMNDMHSVTGVWPDSARRPFLGYPQNMPLAPQFAAAHCMYPQTNALAKLPPISMIQPQDDFKAKTVMSATNTFPGQNVQSPFMVSGTPIPQWAPLASGQDCSVFETKSAEADNGSKPRRKYTTCRRSVRAWTEEEHTKFLEGLEKFRTEDTQAMKDNGELSVGLGPGIAEIISVFIGTRSVTQVRSHAQKYFQRMKREQNKGSNSE